MSSYLNQENQKNLNDKEVLIEESESNDKKPMPKQVMRFSVGHENFDEKEETTIIDEITCLKFSPVKSYLLFPFLCLITIFILPLMCYYFVNLKIMFHFDKVEFGEATHLLILGRT